MSLKVIRHTACSIATVPEAKRWCRIDNDAEDDVFALLLDSATDYVHRVARLDLGQTQYGLLLDSFPTPNWYRFYPNLYPYPQLITLGLPWNSLPLQTIELEQSPVLSVDSIIYYDTTGTQQTLSNTKYNVDLANGRIAPIHNSSWPLADNRLDAVTVTYTTGFDATNYPKVLKMAVLNYVLLCYQYRDGIPEKARDALNNACIGLRDNYIC